jgi:hypothetical protein
MQYPLQEKIGAPSLLVLGGRERPEAGAVIEFQNFGKWLKYIPRKLSKSRVILARRYNENALLCNAYSTSFGVRTGLVRTAD